MCAREKARKTGGCQRQSPRASRDGANRREEETERHGGGPSQQPSPPGTDATRTPRVLHPMPKPRNSLHRQEPMPLRRARRTAGHLGPRNSLHRQEPMPPAVRRATARCGFSSQQPSPPGTDATWLSPSSASSCSILATAFTARNRCHCTTVRMSTLGWRPRNTLHHQEPMPQEGRSGPTDAHASQHPSPPRTDATGG